MGRTSIDGGNKQLANPANSSRTSELTAQEIVAETSQDETSVEKQGAVAAAAGPEQDLEARIMVQSEVSKWRFITLSSA